MNSPIDFEIIELRVGFQVIAIYKNGDKMAWGTQSTMRGAKSCVTKYKNQIKKRQSQRGAL